MDFSKNLWPNAVCSKTTPSLQNLPQADESFKENVKGAQLQAMVWYAAIEADPPAVDPTL